jgi:hypothetical protein
VDPSSLVRLVSPQRSGEDATGLAPDGDNPRRKEKIVGASDVWSDVVAHVGQRLHDDQLVAWKERNSGRVVAILGICLPDEHSITFTAIENHANGLVGPFEDHLA